MRKRHNSSKQDFFTRFTSTVSSVLGRPWVFMAAVAIILLWALSGPLFGLNNTWQLVINTGTTIITFLMVFIIQNTQNRDNLAINIKLDSIMKKLEIKEADLFEAEDKSDKELEAKKAKQQRR
jgi:low affinity Fe/Cu permease